SRASADVRGEPLDRLLVAVRDLVDEDTEPDGGWLDAAIAVALAEPELGPAVLAAAEDRRRGDIDERWVRMARTLPAAAASGTALPRAVATDVDESVTVTCVEDADGRVVLRIDATERREVLVHCRWRIVSTAGSRAGEVALFTPLAATRQGFAAQYAIEVSADEDIELAAPRWALASELDDAAVRAAVTDAMFGLARRAWRAACDDGRLTGPIRLLVEELLSR
ncbi:MAG: hypothetical protein AB7W59_27845, partial [Acidimicrobiia bacterium]